jgi:predicted nuclease of restriction endonuclease-like (RecB) superfamily
VNDDKARAFYINETVACNWSTRTLDKQIGNLYYQRMIMSKDKIDVKNKITENQVDLLPKYLIKDPYVLAPLQLHRCGI